MRASRVALPVVAAAVLAAGCSAGSARPAGPGGHRSSPPAAGPDLPGRQAATVRRSGTYAAGVEIRTGYGPARAELDEPAVPAFLLVLTHGAGGGADTPDLLAVRDAAVRLDGAVARVTQPYRAREARAPGAATRQDAAWLEIISALRERFPGIPCP